MPPWILSGNGIDPRISPIYRRTAVGDFQLRSVGAPVFWDQNEGSKALPFPTRQDGDLLIAFFASAARADITEVTPANWTDMGGGNAEGQIALSVGGAADGVSFDNTAYNSVAVACMCSFKLPDGSTLATPTQEGFLSGASVWIHIPEHNDDPSPGLGDYIIFGWMKTGTNQNIVDTSPTFTENFQDPFYKVLVPSWHIDGVAPADDLTVLCAGWAYLQDSDILIPADNISAVPAADSYGRHGYTVRIKIN